MFARGVLLFPHGEGLLGRPFHLQRGASKAALDDLLALEFGQVPADGRRRSLHQPAQLLDREDAVSGQGSLNRSTPRQRVTDSTHLLILDQN